MSDFAAILAKRQAWLDGESARRLKAERLTKRLERDLRSALKRLGAKVTAALVVALFRKHGYPTEIRRHL